MKAIQTDDIHLKAEVYSELINDMQAKIFEFENEHPDCMNEKIKDINHRLSIARMESRIYVDEEHFHLWDELLLSANTTIIKSKLFR